MKIIIRKPGFKPPIGGVANPAGVKSATGAVPQLSASKLIPMKPRSTETPQKVAIPPGIPLNSAAAKKATSIVVAEAKKATSKVELPTWAPSKLMDPARMDPTRVKRMRENAYKAAQDGAGVTTKTVSVALGALAARFPAERGLNSPATRKWLTQFIYERAVHEEKGLAVNGVLNEAGIRWANAKFLKIRELIAEEIKARAKK